MNAGREFPTRAPGTCAFSGWQEGLRAWAILRLLSVKILPLFLVLASFTAGCVTPRPFLPGFYSRLNITPLSEPLPSVTVYSLLDERPTKVILESRSISGRSRDDLATEPVSDGVTRAFIEGFRTRGFAVVDKTSKHYFPGEAGAETQVVISGRVLEFGARIIRSGVFTYDQRVACTVVLEAYEAATARKLWEKSYSRVTEGWMLPADPMTVLSRALAQIVEEAAADPELLRAIRLKS